MIAAHGLHWLDRQPQGPRWPSYGVAAAVTAALFVVALVSMRSVGWRETEREMAPAPVVVPLRPPVPFPRDVPIAQPQPQPKAIRRPIERAPQIPIAPPILAPPTVVTPPAPIVAVPVAPPFVSDTSRRPRDISPAIPTTPIVRPHNYGLPDTAMAIRGGAAYAPAGVTISSRTKNSAKLRDSIITEKLALVPELARTTPMSAEAASVIGTSQGQAAMLAQRSTSAGNWRDLHVPMGSGVGGVGAVNGGKSGVTMDSRGIGVSVPFPLFSSGPSPAERKRNEKLYAEYLAFLRGQQERLLLKRDSIRADSIRADSLRLDSLAKRRR